MSEIWEPTYRWKGMLNWSGMSAIANGVVMDGGKCVSRCCLRWESQDLFPEVSFSPITNISTHIQRHTHLWLLLLTSKLLIFSWETIQNTTKLLSVWTFYAVRWTDAPHLWDPPCLCTCVCVSVCTCPLLLSAGWSLAKGMHNWSCARDHFLDVIARVRYDEI